MSRTDRGPFSHAAVARWLSDQFLSAIAAGDRREAERVARDGLDAGLTPSQLHSGVIAPAMHEVGERWVRGEMSVAEEHLATTITFAVVALVRHVAQVEAARRDRSVLLATVQGEQHALGLQMASDLLEAAGFETRLLGADVPLEDLCDMASDESPDLVALSLTMPEAAGRAPVTVNSVSRAAPRARIILGGRAAPQRLTTPTLSVVPDVADVVEAADALLLQAAAN